MPDEPNPAEELSSATEDALPAKSNPGDEAPQDLGGIKFIPGNCVKLAIVICPCTRAWSWVG
jgi:hypothetical protein